MNRELRMLLSIFIGNLLIAFAVSAFVVPFSIMQGGTVGLSFTLKYLLPFDVRLSVVNMVINWTLFIVGFIFLGWKFSVASLSSTILFPMMLRFFEDYSVADLFASEELTLVAVCCGLMIGCGIGLIIRAGGSSGGIDIIACILSRKKGIPVGTSLMVFDFLIILMQVIIRGMEGILLSIVVIAVTSFSVNYFTILGKKKVEILIISPRYQEIRKALLEVVDCGLTLFDVETGYLALGEKAILSVVYASRYKEVRDVVLKYDEKAFIVVNNVREVRGRGYTFSRYSES